MRNGRSKLVVILGIAIALVIACPLVIVLINRPTVPPVTLPTPNAYDTLSEAGNLISQLPSDYAETEDVAKLQAFVEANAPAVDLLNSAVDQQCVVPINYDGKMEDVADTTQPIRQAMRLLHASARIAELENNPANAAREYAKIFELSSKSANGGFIVHTLVAAGHERLALNKLQELAVDLTAQQRQEVRELIASVDRQPRNIDEIVQREQILVKKEQGTLSGTWMIWATQGLAQPAIQQATAVDAEIVQRYQEVLDLLAE